MPTIQQKNADRAAIDLTRLSFRELIRKFAAGAHKPGSGSAIALLGLTSCALAKTVVGLSLGRKKYRSSLTALIEVRSRIEDEIEPELWRAFAEDSEQFHKVITARKARNNERAPHQRWKLARRARDELYAANEIPLLVAEKCLLLAELGVRVFDVGFQSARGDSAVAVDSALSAVTGAISIVYLNLASFRGQIKAKEQLARAEHYEQRANELRRLIENRRFELRSDATKRNGSFGLCIDVIRDPRGTESKYSFSEVEEIARNLQNELWINRNDFWPGAEIETELGVLDPAIALRVLGYKFDEEPSLGEFTNGNAVAGIIDKQQFRAAVSKRFPPVVRRFTAAHELGHAVLHRKDIQFRDRPLDGSIDRGRRSSIENEADKFAAYFLMPESVMRDVFREVFRGDQFVVSEDAAFAIGFKDLAQLFIECPSPRQLSLRIAKTDFVAGRAIRPIATTFGVSVGAMVIRIEELRLIDANGYYGD